MLARILFLITLLILPMTSYAGGDFSLIDTKGHTHKLSNYRGKWVLVNLWATWCPNCISEMPELSKLSRTNKNVVVLGLATDGQDPKQVIAFANRFKASYPIIAGNEQQAKLLVNIQGYPTSLLYNPAGNLVAYKVGPVKEKDIDTYIKSLKFRATAPIFASRREACHHLSICLQAASLRGFTHSGPSAWRPNRLRRAKFPGLRVPPLPDVDRP